MIDGNVLKDHILSGCHNSSQNVQHGCILSMNQSRGDNVMKSIQIVRKADRRLTCPSCKTRSLLHLCKENGIKVVYGTKQDPIEVWEADLYCCECGAWTIIDFGRWAMWTKRRGFIKGLEFPEGRPSVTQWLACIEKIADADKRHFRIGVVYVELKRPHPLMLLS